MFCKYGQGRSTPRLSIAVTRESRGSILITTITLERLRKEVMKLCYRITGKLPYVLMNRCIREPYVQWCERRTPSANYWRSRLLDYVRVIHFSLIFSLFLFSVGDASPLQSQSNGKVRSVKAQKCRSNTVYFPCFPSPSIFLKSSKLSLSLLGFSNLSNPENRTNASKMQVLHNSLFFGLKGQLILAPDNVWGKRNNRKTVRAETITKAKIFFRTKFGCIPLRPKERQPFKICYSADDFNAHFPTQGVTPFALG